MATTTSITTTYAGEFAGDYISAALLSGVTIDNGGITVKPNVKFKEVIKKVATDGIVKDGTCDFADTSTITLTERIIEPKTFQVNLELCKADFRSDWDAIQMGYSAFDTLPKSFADFLIAHAAEKVAAGMETSIWSGVNATAGEFAGIMTQLTTDASLPSAQEIAAVGGGVNAGNVIAELGKIVDACPAALYGKEDLTIYVSNNLPYVGNGAGTALSTGSETNFSVMVAGHDSAVAVADQIAKVETFRSPDTFSDVVRGMQLYGRKVLRPEALFTANYNLA